MNAVLFIHHCRHCQKHAIIRDNWKIIAWSVSATCVLWSCYEMLLKAGTKCSTSDRSMISWILFYFQPSKRSLKGPLPPEMIQDRGIPRGAFADAPPSLPPSLFVRKKNIIPFNLLMSDLFFIPKRWRRGKGSLPAFFKAFFSEEEAAAENDISSSECVEAANCTTDRPDSHSFCPSAQSNSVFE